MKKEYVKQKHPTYPDEKIKKIMRVYWKKYDKSRKTIFFWLNKTDAPKEVWDACESFFVP